MRVEPGALTHGPSYSCPIVSPSRICISINPSINNQIYLASNIFISMLKIFNNAREKENKDNEFYTIHFYQRGINGAQNYTYIKLDN